MGKKLLPAPLAQGYENFRTGRYTDERDRYLKLADKQKPTVMIIACCDSRAAPETIFDAGPGELFVVRNVANLVPPYAPDGKQHSTSAALEFATIALGVSHIMVMGHGRCGGIAAASAPEFNPLTAGDFIGKWIADIKDVVTNTPVPDACCADEKRTLIERASVEHSLANLRTFPWLRTRENQKELTIQGTWFDIGLGELHVFDEANQTWLKA